FRIAIAQLQRLVHASGSARRDRGATDTPVVQPDVDFDSGVASRIEDLARVDGGDLRHQSGIRSGPRGPEPGARKASRSIRPSTSTRSFEEVDRSGTASTLATSRRSPREMVMTSPSLTGAEGFAAAPLIRTRPASHSVCASVRRRTRLLTRKHLPNRITNGNAGSRERV